MCMCSYKNHNSLLKLKYFQINLLILSSIQLTCDFGFQLIPSDFWLSNKQIECPMHICCGFYLISFLFVKYFYHAAQQISLVFYYFSTTCILFTHKI